MSMDINRIKCFLFFTFCFLITGIYAQEQPAFYFKDAIEKNRSAEYHNIVNNGIIKSLSFPLTDSTEDAWEDAFGAIELIQYKSSWCDSRIQIAFDSVEKRSSDFQHALLELAYANYPGRFHQEVSKLLEQTNDEKIFALCAEQLRRTDSSQKMKAYILSQLEVHNNLFGWYQKPDNVSVILSNSFFKQKKLPADKMLLPFLSKGFMKKNVVVYSIQRKNRDFPGIVIIKDTSGNFIKNKDGSIFYVPQLARSISNLPFYLTNGNTPQGIFRMYGFAVSGANFIGPTQNIQLSMPFETSIRHFLKDSTITDTAWTEYLYKKLLPVALQDYLPLYESYYASQAGRTEIIAHGTTVNPQYYEGKPYYPQTPTEGCLCTKEIWSRQDGERLESDQQKLIDGVKKAGGADGYYIVIEIDNQRKPVNIEEILPFIK